MRPRSLLGLALVTLLLGAGLWLGGQRPDSDQQRAQQRRVAPTLVPAEVREVRLEQAGATPRVAQLHSGTRWELVAPVRARADRKVVHRVLSSTEFLEYVRVVPASRSPASMGLEPPRLRLVLRQRGGAVRLDLGRRDTSGHGVFLRHRGRVVVVHRSYRETLERAARALRDRQLIPLVAAQIDRVRLGRPAVAGQSAPWLRRNAGGWTVTLPGRGTLRAHPYRAARLIQALAGLPAARFLQRAPSVDQPRSTLTIHSRGFTGRLALGGPCPGRVAQRVVRFREAARPWATACVASADAAPLTVEPTTLVDHALLRRSAAQLGRIQLTAGARTLTLRRDGGRWLLASGAAVDVDQVRRWIRRLGALRGTLDPPPGAPRAAALDAATLRLVPDQAGAEATQLLVGQATAGKVPARRHGDTMTLWYPGELAAMLRPEPLSFQRKKD